MRPLLAILFGTVLGAQTPRTGPDGQTRRATLEGALEDSIRNRTTPVGSPRLNSFAARIAAAFRGDLRLTVIREDDIAPLALANGALFVPLSLFQAAENEAEFAAALAYAIARTALSARDPHRTIPMRSVHSCVEWAAHSRRASSARHPANMSPTLAHSPKHERRLPRGRRSPGACRPR